MSLVKRQNGSALKNAALTYASRGLDERDAELFTLQGTVVKGKVGTRQQALRSPQLCGTVPTRIESVR